MDVSCERCKAEYEFDDSLLGEHGTTVKCSSCGHVFRVLPSSKEPTRPSLKLRYVRDGRVVALTSLRDLQKRVHAGEVGLNDELGREGFPWRKLSEVPELRSFFTKPSGASSSFPQPAADPARRPAALSVSQSSMPAPRDGNPSAKRTILGVGPQNPQIPGPPRVPNVQVPGVTPEAQPAAANKPASATASQGARVQTVGHAASGGAFDSDRPTDASKKSLPSANPHLGTPPPTLSNPVPQLYLSEHEAPPARATESSSRIWIAAGVALVLVLGGAAVVTAMRKTAATDEPAPVPAGRVEAPTPAPSIVPDPAEQAAAPTPAPTPATPTPAPAPAPAAQPAPSEAPVAAPTGGTEAEAKKAGGGGGKPHEAASGGTPNDYGGWVAQGDAALGRGDAATAEKAYTQALTLRASGSEAATGLGYALITEGKAREAIPYFERAAKNGYAEASIGLGDAHKKLGNTEASRRAYKSYIERLPGGSRAAYVEKQLASLGGGGGGGAAAEPAGAKQPEAEPEPSPAQPDSEYRPAGELTQPPSGAPDEAAP